ncbi:DgyrCDS6248 [Dimorphilus gyrociliatus]|uniref:DgyrCDS6248 n=1 Tax=Dimorphilus gyrociliatus TaxID=2664684 RepID=A0A7I8VQB1_9ANNE|nr:DgyrCDS6248 [Dimorphilus gyrociliatus]
MNRMNMMDQFQVAAEEDDMYGGFGNQVDETETLTNDPAFQQAVRTSHGRRPPPTAARLKTGVRGNIIPPSSMGRPGPSSLGRPMTGSVDGANRPMTAVRGAGYSSQARGVGYDSGKSAAPALEGKGDDTPEERIRQLEKKVNELIEESCIASASGDYQTSLEKAKEAGRKERLLVREREKLSSADQINLDLTYSALFNLANQYTLNEMYNEALNTYQIIVKNKMFSMAGRLKVNMGNIYFKQRQYSKAIKFYRMALDQIPNTHRGMRIKVMHNISVSFVKLGQYNDAVTSLEVIMQEEPDMRTGLNLVLCYFALGDKEKMKKTFQRMLTVDLKIDDDEKYAPHPDDAQHTLILEVIKNDSLRQIERERRNTAERCIKTAAKLISPAIEHSFTAGYDWCMDQVKTSNFMELAHDLEIDKAIGYLKKKDFAQAVDALKSFEKKDTKVACTAATNLSFLYYVSGEESDLNQADKYADLALTADKYNPPALVNKGNIYFKRRDYEKAREFYKEALQNDSSCVEALYNAGLCNKKLKRYRDALDSFYKLHSILRNNGQVLFQIADLLDLMGENAQAQEMFMQLLGVVPTDAAILARLGQMFDAENDKAQAFQYNYDSYRYNPSNIKIIEWLGAYYIESQFCEKAIQYFERGAIIQ